MTICMSSNILYDPMWNKCLNVCGLLGLSLRLFSEGTTNAPAGKRLRWVEVHGMGLTYKENMKRQVKKSNKNLKEGWSLSLVWGCSTVSPCLLTDRKGCSDGGERTRGCHAVALLKALPPAAARRRKRRTEVVLMTRVIVMRVAMDCQHRVLKSGHLFHEVRHPVKV